MMSSSLVIIRIARILCWFGSFLLQICGEKRSRQKEKQKIINMFDFKIKHSTSTLQFTHRESFNKT